MSIKAIIQDLKEREIIPVKEPVQMSFGTKEQCKVSFIEIFSTVDETIEKFVYYKGYDEIVDWLTDNKGKGLALFGSVGTGKSVFLRSVLPVFMTQYAKFVRIIGLTDFMLMDGDDFRTYLKWGIIAIDEVGREPMACDYGKKFEAVPILIESCEINSKLLFLTSNATREEIVRRYGNHTMDRINKLCRIITITGKSNRK